MFNLIEKRAHEILFSGQGFSRSINVLTFIFCWLPHHILNLVILFKEDFEFTKKTFIVKIASHCLSFCHGKIHYTVFTVSLYLVQKHRNIKLIITGMLNPLLYGFMSDWMRNHLKNMWHNYRCWNPHSAFRNRLNSKFFTSNTTVRF